MTHEDIENAITNKKPVYINSVQDATLYPAPNGVAIVINNLFWKLDGEIYRCWIQPRCIQGLIINYYVVGSVTEHGMSSGDTSMFRKGNRLCR